MKGKKENVAFRLVITAILAALICVATMIVRIPVPSTGGYANLGDGVLLIGAFLMNPVCAALAAGIGSMLADMLAGYMQFAIGTFVIKAVMAYAAALVFHHMAGKKQDKKPLLAMICGAVLAEILMVLGYFVFEATILGYGMGAAGSIPGNLGQGLVGILVSCAVAPVLRKNNDLRNLMNKI